MIEFSPSILIPSSKSLLDIMINFLKAAQDDPVIDEAHTVDLIWKLLALNPLLETYLIESLIREFRTEVGFQVFGIIWKFSKDHDKLCIYFSRPLITVLDSLKSKKFRSAAENWFHLYLTSYRHILRPLLTILSSPSIRTAPVTIKESIQYFEYSCEFDSQLVEYAFEQLSYLFQFAKSQVGLELTKLMHQTEKSFFEIISDHCLTFMRTFPVVDKSTYESLQLNACKCLSLAMLALPESFHTELISKKNVFFSDLLQLLHVCIYLEVHMLQVHILDLFGILIPFGFHPITSGFPLGSNLSLSQTSQIKTSPMLSSMDSASINALLILSLTSPTNRILLPNYIEWMTLWMHVFSIYESLVSVFIRQLRVTVQQAMYENQFLAYLRGLQYLFAYIYPISHSPTVPIPEPDQTNALSEFKEAFHRVFPELIDLFVIVSTDPPDHKTSPHQFHFLLSARKRLLRFAQRILEICPKTWLDALVYDWCLRQSRQFSETLLVSQMDLLHLVESTLLRINFSLNSHSGSGSSSISVYTLCVTIFIFSLYTRTD
ncbi:hypothetical protein HMI56_004259 [Coelomomyces lativittatus]|nr:hypothetical protein HMI56_004259 [Coelomomyces lativittatus]